MVTDMENSTHQKDPKRDCGRAWGLGRALRVRTTCARPQAGKSIQNAVTLWGL